MTPSPGSGARETFATRLGLILTMVGLSVGLGNVWRFPYMTGRFGGAAFVVLYLAFAFGIGIPALMAEWALGRHTRRGPVGTYERVGVRGGRALGWIVFAAIAAATAYYSNAIGWVLWHALSELSAPLGRPIDGSAILPPERGIDGTSLSLQLACTVLVVCSAAAVLMRGVRRGIEKASSVLTPAVFVVLLILLVRSVTLPGAGEGLRWFLFKFEPGAITPGVALAALGQVVFSIGLGGSMMLIYGSYLKDDEDLTGSAIWTVIGDTGAGLLAGFALFPAVFALGLEPASGPGLLFETLPGVFTRLPQGWIFGSLFFLGLCGAAWLSAVAALEVLIGGLDDNTSLGRRRSATIAVGVVLLLAVPPMFNLRIFVPWDLTFGSGTQTAGALLAALTFGWALDRGTALEALSKGGAPPALGLLHFWIRFVIPGAMLAVGGWWMLTDVLGVVGGV